MCIIGQKIGRDEEAGTRKEEEERRREKRKLSSPAELGMQREQGKQASEEPGRT